MMKNKLILFLSFLGFLIGCTAADPSPQGEVLIRIANQSNFTFDNVFVSTPGGEHTYEWVVSKQKSEYKAYSSAYRYAFILVQAGEDTLILQPIDYVGEKLLKPGKYTYSLDADEVSSGFGSLNLTLVQD